MARWNIGIGILSVALCAGGANAQNSYCGGEPPRSAFTFTHFNDDQMNYSVVTSGSARVLLAEGGVGNEEGARLDAAIQQAGNIDEVWLSSPGGNLDQGEAMGRVLRKRGLMVRVPDGHACISACTIAFLGGQIRSVDPGAFYGIHMFSLYFEETDAAKDKVSLLKELVAAEKIQPGGSTIIFRREMMDLERSTAQGAAKLAKYLVEMSASLDFLTGMFGQKQTGVCYVTVPGLVRYNISNTQ